MANITRAEYDAKVLEIKKTTSDLKAQGRKLRALRRKFERQEGTYVPRAHRGDNTVVSTEPGNYTGRSSKDTPAPKDTLEAYTITLLAALEKKKVHFSVDEPKVSKDPSGFVRKTWPAWWCIVIKDEWLAGRTAEDIIEKYKARWAEDVPDLFTVLDTNPPVLGLRNSSKSLVVLQE